VTINEIIERRGIEEVVHFTTHKGLLGSLHSGAVKSRKRLPTEVNLQFIYQPNANFRKDRAWLDFVNLSISRINKEFFNVSCRWHRAEDLWWCIMSFEPAIMEHPEVYFATTNNMYTGVRRGKGGAALENLFAPHVTRWSDNVVARSEELPENFTTCGQAEVLYPGELSVKHLRHIYVVRDEDADEVHAQLAMIGFQGVDVIVTADKFL
jgi:ssDNA thymidine ADP-ribosyltransferase DarT-like protein